MPASAAMIPTPFQSRHVILVNAIVLAMLSGCGGGEPVPITPTNEASSRSAIGFARTLEQSPTAAGRMTALAAPLDGGAVAPGAARSAGPATAGVLLEGAAGMNAIAAVHDFTAPSNASPGLAKPRVEAILSPTAMVGQVNAALTLVGARIVGMQSGNSRLMLELSSAGASTTPEALSQRLAYSRAFEPYQPPPPPVEDHQPLPDEPQAH